MLHFGTCVVPKTRGVWTASLRNFAVELQRRRGIYPGSLSSHLTSWLDGGRITGLISLPTSPHFWANRYDDVSSCPWNLLHIFPCTCILPGNCGLSCRLASSPHCLSSPARDPRKCIYNGICTPPETRTLSLTNHPHSRSCTRRFINTGVNVTATLLRILSTLKSDPKHFFPSLEALQHTR
jgi:hypothetical protein